MNIGRSTPNKLYLEKYGVLKADNAMLIMKQRTTNTSASKSNQTSSQKKTTKLTKKHKIPTSLPKDFWKIHFSNWAYRR
jgi:hypothetical protein